jgi:xylulokinase
VPSFCHAQARRERACAMNSCSFIPSPCSATDPKCHLSRHARTCTRKSRCQRLVYSRLTARQCSKTSLAVLAIDVGTSGAKAGMICVETGKLLSFARRAHKSHSPAPFHVVQDSRDWRQSSILAAREASQLALVKGSVSVLAVAITGAMQNLSCVTNASRLAALESSLPPLMRDGTVVLYSDSRAQKCAERIERAIDVSVSPTSLLAKLAYLQDHTKAATGLDLTFSKGWALSLGAADSVVFDFGGELVTDPTNVSTTDLTRSPHRSYDESLLRAASLDNLLDCLPPIRSSGVCGVVSKEVADEIGLPSLVGIPLVHAGGDAATTTIGAGCYSPNGEQYLYMGTTGWVGRTISSTDTASDIVSARSANGVFYLGHSLNDQWSIELGSMASAGSCLAWTANLLGGISIPKLLELAGQAPVGCNGALFLPYLSGRRCPQPNARMTGGFHGLTGCVGPSDIARACVEGVVFGYKACWQSICAQVGVELTSSSKATTLRFVGGGARSNFVAQIIAGGLNTRLSIGPKEEVGLVGAARVALWSLAEACPTDCQVAPMDETLVEPVHCERSQAEYEEAWQRWRSHCYEKTTTSQGESPDKCK